MINVCCAGFLDSAPAPIVCLQPENFMFDELFGQDLFLISLYVVRARNLMSIV